MPSITDHHVISLGTGSSCLLKDGQKNDCQTPSYWQCFFLLTSNWKGIFFKRLSFYWQCFVQVIVTWSTVKLGAVACTCWQRWRWYMTDRLFGSCWSLNSQYMYLLRYSNQSIFRSIELPIILLTDKFWISNIMFHWVNECFWVRSVRVLSDSQTSQLRIDLCCSNAAGASILAEERSITWCYS